MRLEKTQISLGITSVWSESSLLAIGQRGSSVNLCARSEYSDQTAHMLRLIIVFAWCTLIFLVCKKQGTQVRLNQMTSYYKNGMKQHIFRPIR